MGAQQVAAFLTWLAVERRVAASTQVQAQAAPVSLYWEVLGRPLRLAVSPAPQPFRIRLPSYNGMRAEPGTAPSNSR
jgi:hypothetical protein